MRVVLIGPPGSGKGTQAKKLAASLGVPHVATGDMLRDAVGRGTALGKRAEPLLKAGRLVPDDVVIGVALERLAGGDCKRGVVLDGFPRTVPQAGALEQEDARLGRKIDRVVLLAVPQATITARLSGRRSCPECGAVYHVKHAPPKREGMCDKHPVGLVQRPDDREEVVIHRFEVYREETRPLEVFFRERGVLSTVECDDLGPDEVFVAMRRLLGLEGAA